MMDDNTPFIAEVLDINDNAKQSSTTSAIALENAEAKCDDEVDANSSSSTPLIDRKRRDNIKRNQERFQQLGLLDATKEMNKVANQKKKNTKNKKAEKQSKALQAKKVVPSRRAKRGIKYPNTNESDEEKSACESTILFQSFVDCYSFTLIFLTKYHYFQ
jgi:hypothetical protein